MFSLLRTAARVASTSYSHANTFRTLQFRAQLRREHTSRAPPEPIENLNVAHSRFLAEGSQAAKWNEYAANPDHVNANDPADGYDVLPDGQGK